jgi:hypothetical protein
MRDFPESMKKTVEKPEEEFWHRCEKLLHVTMANELSDPCFGKRLQADIQSRLDAAVRDKKIPTAYLTNDAPLAVGRKTAIKNSVAFDKFSTPGPLLKVYEQQRQLAKEGRGHPLMIATDTVVERFRLEDYAAQRSKPNILHTSRGTLCFPNGRTNIILAAGTIPTTTLLMNSIGDRLEGRAGSRISGHYISHLTAGKDESSGLQYHVQITAIHSPDPEQDAEDAARLCPDYAAAATAQQLSGSKGYIVLGLFSSSPF